MSDRLTLNLGLRYEYEGATYDTEDRNVRGFDPDAVLAIGAAAEAAYAPRTDPRGAALGLPRARRPAVRRRRRPRASGAPDTNNWQPRFGAAYQISDKTVLRGGFGVYTSPFVIAGVRQSGFSQSTNIVPTLDNGLTFVGTLANPFPSGVQDPVGSSLGPNTFVGRQLDRFSYVEGVRNEQNARWAITVQRELPGTWLLELGYVGCTWLGPDASSRTTTRCPRQYLSTSPARDQATINFLTANVTNPFPGCCRAKG